jgi:uncharacterized protein
MRVFITGGTGLVGSRLIRRLRQRGDEVVLLSRKPSTGPADPGVLRVVGDPVTQGPWMDAVADCDAVVNLAGENLFAKRWNAEFKQSLVKSRVDSTRHVVEALKRSPRPNRVLVSASAIGIYGPHEDDELTEISRSGADFLARLCVDWERAAREAEAVARLVLLRIGVVLDTKGGALGQMLTPFKMGVGGPVGSGKQYMSWIHHDDLLGLFLHALDQAAVAGPMNGTAPMPVTNRAFSTALGKALGRPSFLPTPAFALKLMLGEVADVVTSGARVLPQKALDTGYRFRFADIDSALKDLLAKGET